MLLLEKVTSSVKALRLIEAAKGFHCLILTASELHCIQVNSISDHSVLGKHVVFSLKVNVDDDGSRKLVHMDSLSRLVAITQGPDLSIFASKKSLNKLILLGSHSMPILNLMFVQTHPVVLATFSEDVCKLWDLERKQLVHTIPVTKLTPSAVCLQREENLFLYGTTDGQILSVNMSNNRFTPSRLLSLQQYSSELTKCALSESEAKVSNKPDPNGRPKWSTECRLAPRISNEVTFQILSLAWITILTPEMSTPKQTEHKLSIITCSRFCIIDVASRHLEATWSWVDLGLSDWTYILAAEIAVSPTAINFWLKSKDGAIAFFSYPYQSDRVRSSSRDFMEDFNNIQQQTSALSLLARGDLQPNSILCKSLRRQTEPTRPKPKPKPKPGKPLNQAITFGHPIKSSGYAKQEPRRKMFQPLTNTRNNIKTKSTGSEAECVSQLKKTYTPSDDAPNALNYSGAVDGSKTPIYSLAYAPNGTRLAVALGSSVCLVLRISRSQKARSDAQGVGSIPPGETLCGHKGPVLCASWSSDSRLLLTSSADRTVRLWMMSEPVGLSRGDASKLSMRLAMVVDSVNGGSTNCYGEPISTQIPKKDKTFGPSSMFPDCVQFVYFHYLDSFIYAVCRNVIRLFSYELASVTNVLDKGRSNSTYKLAGEFTIESCNRLTAVSSANIFYSYLLLCAGSDRQLSVLDLNTNQTVHQLDSAHSRNITAIALNQGSLYSSLTNTRNDSLSLDPSRISTGYSTFATVAPGDCVRMWDLRDMTRPVIQFMNPDVSSGNTASGAPSDPLVPSVNATFSPCGRHLAVGGRVNVTQPYPVIYDTRKPCSHPLAVLSPSTGKMPSAPSTVVAWHPSRVEVATGSHDGQLATYVR
ncbi:WD repeat-containing protein 27, variant 2 [Clonorchis sinensis]|nr:WD repeat-containing protein 27, variant 2 [Clonorchis sinensis]